MPLVFRGADALEASPLARRFMQTHAYVAIGGERSGSRLHVDPRHTGAWNALLCGAKRWALLQPSAGAPPSPALPVGVWFAAELASAAAGGGLLETMQAPGETLWVPHAWAHAVYNLGELTVAVTHNLLPWEDLRVPAQLRPLAAAYSALAAYLHALALRQRPELAAAMAEACALPTRPADGCEDEDEGEGGGGGDRPGDEQESASARAFAARGMGAEYYYLAAAGMYGDYYKAAERLLAEPAD